MLDDERTPDMISLHPHRHRAGPPQGPGRYSADGQHWFDEAGGRLLPVVDGHDTLCIQLEAAGWSRVGCGGHPWAWRYTRPRVDWPSDTTPAPVPADS